ncbi:MAG: fumarylacetoacetate hydrolase family protein [Nocardiopsaceae bacterium]|jgi:fumarylacetoacetate (FAA) hydrolase|nr:fumarylacetoacetate hydrolase family protein [Nocardiopsaceae bacterium]
MRLCTFRTAGGPPEGWPGRIDGDLIVRLDAPDLIAVLAGGSQGAAASTGPAVPVSEAELLPPVPRPPSVRDFFAFEAHVAAARAGRGAPVPAEWYEFPAFYFSNPAAIYGPDAQVPYPAGTAMLDYELEAAAVIGAGGRIAGFTIMNDWSARDIQRQEMRVGLGPAKAKDFATSLGPVVVTADEFDGSSAVMTARVNGEERSRGELSDLYFSWPDIAAQAVRNTVLRPGEILGSGTVGTGCILEHGDNRWLVPGDTVELEVAGIGILRNQVGPRQPAASGAAP